MDLAAATAYITSFVQKLKKEGFEDKPAEQPQPQPQPATQEQQLQASGYGTFAMIGIFVYILVMFLQSCAGARLSWCYNKSIGTNAVLAVIYAILCFIFPGFYMVLYTFFLAPMCGGEQPKNNIVDSIATNMSAAINSGTNMGVKVGGRRH